MSNSPSSKSAVRQSALEMVRIIAMSMIIIHHFLGGALRLSGELYLLLNPFVYGGVNLFFLLSGYFLIKCKPKSLLRFIGIIFFFRLIPVSISVCSGELWSVRDWLHFVFFPVSHSPHWFLQVYLGIFLLSPVLNIGLKNLSPKGLIRIAGIITLFNAYSCWAGGNLCNAGGYTFFQGLYLYILGYCLSCNRKLFAKVKAKYYVILSVLTLCVIAGLNILRQDPGCMLYSSPFLIFAMAALLLAFAQKNFANQTINSIASASLGVYLLQDGNPRLYDWQYSISQSLYPLWIKVAIFAGVFIGLWIASWLLTKLFDYLFQSLILPLALWIKNKTQIRNIIQNINRIISTEQ